MRLESSGAHADTLLLLLSLSLSLLLLLLLRLWLLSALLKVLENRDIGFVDHDHIRILNDMIVAVDVYAVVAAAVAVVVVVVPFVEMVMVVVDDEMVTA